MDFCTCKNGEVRPSPAMASVPVQEWETTYDLAQSLRQGTIFPSLDLMFYMTGGGENG